MGKPVEVQMVVMIREGSKTSVDTYEGNTLNLEMNADTLLNKIQSSLGLHDTYDVYIKVPSNKKFSDLNIAPDEITAIAIIPTGGSGGFELGRKKPY